MAKPVIRSPLDRLPLHQKQLLVGWLTTGGKDGVGMTYDEARKLVLSEFGLKISHSSLCLFYQRSRLASQNKAETTFDPVSNTLTIVVKLPRATGVPS